MSILVCAACGYEATPDELKYTARLGGTHYKKLEHGLSRANPHASGGLKVRSCGPWVFSVASPQARAQAVRDWHAKRSQDSEEQP